VAMPMMSNNMPQRIGGTPTTLRPMEPDARPGIPVVLVAQALATDGAGRIPMVKNVGSWWLPGGRVEKAEPFITAAVREMKEETSLRLEAEGIAQITQEHKPERHVVYIMVKGTVEGELAIPESDPKISDARWVTAAELPALVPEYGAVWQTLLGAATIDELFEDGGSQADPGRS